MIYRQKYSRMNCTNCKKREYIWETRNGWRWLFLCTPCAKRLYPH